MVKARILTAAIIGVLLLCGLAPGAAGVAVASQPNPPVNLIPDDGTVDIITTATVFAWTYSDPDGHAQFAKWLQIATSNAKEADGGYTSCIFDSGPVLADLEDFIPAGTLLPSTTYYWHVKVQDVNGYWSVWSAETSFTTVMGFAPDQPQNHSPANGATQISPDQRLQGTDFYDPDAGRHYASRWQVTSTAGSYASPLFDSGIDTANLLQIALPAGIADYGKALYWRVMYQDDTGLWSPWSEETSFTIVQNVPPSKPTNSTPTEAAAAVELTPILTASTFSDPDATSYLSLSDSQAASQWQVTSTKGDYSNPVWDSGTYRATASVVVPAGEMEAGKTYYWRVRYQDSRDHWSEYSVETSFTTKNLAPPQASFSADDTDVVAGTQFVTFTDNSTVAGEITSWYWEFGDNTTETWTVSTRPSNGQITHTYTTGGEKTVKLTVKNAAGTDTEVKAKYIAVHATPVASFLAPAKADTGAEITITDNSTPLTDITSWEWSFSDGESVTWASAADRQAAGGQITHTFKDADTQTVSLLVKGPLGESFYTQDIKVSGGGGFGFGLWMILVVVAVIAVIAGAVYLLRGRKAS